MDLLNLLVPGTVSESPPVLGAMGLMDLLVPENPDGEILFNLSSEIENDGEEAEAEDVASEDLYQPKKKRMFLSASERLSNRVDPELVLSEFLKFNCPLKCPSGGKCLTSGLVTIDSTTQCRTDNMNRTTMQAVKEYAFGRVIGFRVIEEETSFTIRSFSGHEICINAFSFEEGIPLSTVYSIVRDVRQGVVARDPNHGGSRVKGAWAGMESPARMAVMAWFKTQKETADRQPNTWNKKGGGVLYIIEAQRKKDWYRLYRENQFDAGAMSLASIATYSVWRNIHRRHFPELRYRQLKLVDSKNSIKADLRHLRRIGVTQNHAQRLLLTQLSASFDDSNRIERLFYWEFRESAVLLRDIKLSFITDGADQELYYAPRYVGMAHQRDNFKAKLVGTIVHGRKVIIHIIAPHVPTGANLTCTLVDDCLGEIAKSGPLPIEARFQVDGASENWCSVVFAHFELMVAHSVFQRVSVVRNPVGSTHEDIDAFFALLKEVMAFADVLTWEDLIQAIRDATSGYKIEVVIKIVDVVGDYMGLYAPHIDARFSGYGASQYQRGYHVFTAEAMPLDAGNSDVRGSGGGAAVYAYEADDDDDDEGPGGAAAGVVVASSSSGMAAAAASRSGMAAAAAAASSSSSSSRSGTAAAAASRSGTAGLVVASSSSCAVAGAVSASAGGAQVGGADFRQSSSSSSSSHLKRQREGSEIDGGGGGGDSAGISSGSGGQCHQQLTGAAVAAGNNVWVRLKNDGKISLYRGVVMWEIKETGAFDVRFGSSTVQMVHRIPRAEILTTPPAEGEDCLSLSTRDDMLTNNTTSDSSCVVGKLGIDGGSSSSKSSSSSNSSSSNDNGGIVRDITVLTVRSTNSLITVDLSFPEALANSFWSRARRGDLGAIPLALSRQSNPSEAVSFTLVSVQVQAKGLVDAAGQLLNRHGDDGDDVNSSKDAASSTAVPATTATTTGSGWGVRFRPTGDSDQHPTAILSRKSTTGGGQEDREGGGDGDAVDVVTITERIGPAIAGLRKCFHDHCHFRHPPLQGSHGSGDGDEEKEEVLGYSGALTALLQLGVSDQDAQLTLRTRFARLTNNSGGGDGSIGGGSGSGLTFAAFLRLYASSNTGLDAPSRSASSSSNEWVGGEDKALEGLWAEGPDAKWFPLVSSARISADGGGAGLASSSSSFGRPSSPRLEQEARLAREVRFRRQRQQAEPLVGRGSGESDDIWNEDEEGDGGGGRRGGRGGEGMQGGTDSDSAFEAKARQERAIREAFDTYDLNGDGLITYLELRTVFARSNKRHVSELELREWIRARDRSSRGGVTFSDFRAAFLGRG